MKKIPCSMFIITIITVLIVYSVTVNNAYATSQWEPLGPEITEIHCFTHDTTNNILYLVTGHNTHSREDPDPTPRIIISSRDDGKNWEEISRVYTRHIYDLKINPYNPSILYLSCYSQEFYVSEDMGFTWTHYNPGIIIKDYIIDPRNPNVLHAAGESFFNDQLYFSYIKSEDNGKTWAAVSTITQIPGHISAKAVLSPKNPLVFYFKVSGEFGTRESRSEREGRLYKTIDGGTSWNLISSFDFDYREKLQMDPDSTNILYRITGSKIHQSKDSGESWIDCLSDTIYQDYSNIVFHPDSNNTLYVGARNSIYKSDNRGKSWKKFSNELKTENYKVCRGFGIDHQNTDKLYYIGSDAFYGSTNGGTNWQKTEYGINNSYIFNFALSHSPADTLYAIHERHQILKASIDDLVTNNGVGWDYIYTDFMQGHYLCDIKTDPQNSQIIYKVPEYSGNMAGTAISKDGGKTWTLIDNTLTYVKCMAIDPSGTLYLGGKDANGRFFIYKSIDQGATWEKYKLQSSAEAHSIAVNPNNRNVVYAGGYYTSNKRGILYKTENGGADWRQIGSTITNRIRYIHVDPHNSDRVYVGTNVNFYYSDDAGASWNNTGKEFNKIRSIFADPNYADRIYLATSGGMYLSKDGGINWIELMDGLLEHDVLSMDYDNENKILYVGTNGEGIFRMKIDETNSIDSPSEIIPNSISLLQNYPNPFNPSTTIKYHLPKSNNVMLKIYNLSGQELETLVNEFQTAGEHQITWQPKGLPSGIYLARLHADNHLKTVKLILKK